MTPRLARIWAAALSVAVIGAVAAQAAPAAPDHPTWPGASSANLGAAPGSQAIVGPASVASDPTVSGELTPSTPANEGADPEPAPQSDPAPGEGADPNSGGTKAPPLQTDGAETLPTNPGATPDPTGGPTFSLGNYDAPQVSCGPSPVPTNLLPIYQGASDKYGLGPQGPAILAAINQIETAFGTNTNDSSAGAQGWMQFMPATWSVYGVDADGNGVADIQNPTDAIYGAANYLAASGMPEDPAGAVFAYNHADWYVAEVLANANCFGDLGGNPYELAPQHEVLSCTAVSSGELAELVSRKARKAARNRIPGTYLDAFENAASNYGLGDEGVWALAGVARLESNFGRGMTKDQLHRNGPLGLDGREWRQFSVDGDGDGKITHSSPGDSAATLARLMWSRGSIRAGLFVHNQASWYVESVMSAKKDLEGTCTTKMADYEIALPNTPTAINWNNLTLSNSLELSDIQNNRLDPRIIELLGLITQDHQVTISALRSDHSQMTASGNVSNHFYGRAMDIAAVDGVSCTDVSVGGNCATLGRTLSLLPADLRPTELIYCFDLDGAGPAFALPDHCDHVHAGYDF